MLCIHVANFLKTKYISQLEVVADCPMNGIIFGQSDISFLEDVLQAYRIVMEAYHGGINHGNGC